MCGVRWGVVGLVGVAVLASLVLAGTAMALNTPLNLDPSQTLAEQFDYRPAYTQNIPVFDASNRPYIRSRGASQDDTSYVHVLEDGIWVKYGFLDALGAAYPDFADTVNAGGWATDRVEFDEYGRAYQILTIRLNEGQLKNVMMYSLDGCKTWRVVELPFGDAVPRYDSRNWGNMAMEHDVGSNHLLGPPFLMFWKQIAPWKGIWASRHKLYVAQPYFVGDTLVVPAPTLVSTKAMAPIQCAGGSTFAVTANGFTYFVFIRIAPRGSRTTPTYIARYDQSSGKVTYRRCLGGARPGNDSHDTPGLCIDTQGILHVVMGAHGYSFQYSHTLRPYDITAWTKKRAILNSGLRTKGTDKDGRGNQTYVSLACDENNTLHLVFRQGRKGVDQYFGGRKYCALAYMGKPEGGSWTQPLVLVRAPHVYGQYYQKLDVDRLGRLFVSMSYLTTSDYESTRSYDRFHHRIVLFSGDGGSTWSLATTADFAAGFTELAPEAQPEPPLPAIVGQPSSQP
jgi:hypothetical protein